MTEMTQQNNTQIVDDGADDYLRAMMEEAQDTGESIDWHEFDAIYQDCLDVDLAQAEYTDWRG